MQQKLASLKAQFEENNKKKLQLEHDVDQCSKKLARAEKLIGGLGGEKTRSEWDDLPLLQIMTSFIGGGGGGGGGI